MIIRQALLDLKCINMGRLKTSILFFSLVNLLWVILRTGTKPSRIGYPCQQAAARNLTYSISSATSLSIAPFFASIKNFISNNRTLIPVILILGVVSGGIFNLSPPNSSQILQLTFASKKATTTPASDIYVVNGQGVSITSLFDLMKANDNYFYNSTEGVVQESEGLISRNDVVLLKINAQWPNRGGTNTDVLKELIQAIIDHPEGFIGEIVVADNGQGVGNMDWENNNAENTEQSTQDVVDMFSSSHNVATYDWQTIRGISVDEYSDGDMTSGYVVSTTTDPETGIIVSYPKFETDFGTYISFKHGIWNGAEYEERLKVINMPVLKSHLCYGVTASLKNYMGVISEGDARYGGVANGHFQVATGGMGTVMAECGLPTLNIIDAIWVNANPWPSSSTGPSTSYDEATRVNVLIAGEDPVALDYWAAKHVLIQTANLIGYTDTHTLDPENTERSGLTEAFGVWLDKTNDEIRRAGYNVTTDENSMNVYLSQGNTTTVPSSVSSTTTTTPVPGFGLLGILLVVTTILLLRRRQHIND
ncbi:MAG: DUF362 domain-containing protein [Candidatus Heimdallarchaeota archaeon]|nr:MAG: DUF362 domain-containing protein [Candidatus Heimdallarchaeota archaeon]